jgi:phospholipase C
MSDTPADDPTTPPGVSRRRLIGSGAAVAGMAAAALALPPNVRTALASPRPGNGRLSDIKHVVMLMQENRSFDHYYGTLSGVRGFSDAHAMRLSSHRPVFFQPDPSNPDGYLLPYRLNSKITAAQAIPPMSHEWAVQHQAWNGGAMDNWVPAHMASDGATGGQYTMGYFTRDDIPFQFALAETFTILDGYHCSVLGPTAPNRHMWMSGTIDPDGLATGGGRRSATSPGRSASTTPPEPHRCPTPPGGTTSPSTRSRSFRCRAFPVPSRPCHARSQAIAATWADRLVDRCPRGVYAPPKAV